MTRTATRTTPAPRQIPRSGSTNQAAARLARNTAATSAARFQQDAAGFAQALLRGNQSTQGTHESVGAGEAA